MIIMPFGWNFPIRRLFFDCILHFFGPYEVRRRSASDER